MHCIVEEPEAKQQSAMNTKFVIQIDAGLKCIKFFARYKLIVRPAHNLLHDIL